ncbi:male sterility protein-domain-containing protein [Colletotrichum godetiae]|uniref:Male sterility protein-domain-containing protein n=1 Tax=Colletotrichum godetiae TaxID=1209918 RepID=A0AAJ0EQ74_9PEZI|nr:male sterility protein-domain-containing protein [Colletotrichum godetiae]KAK1657168.1 male sterility protein-domain-containing protein [Colletotrichum godetiae]
MTRAVFEDSTAAAEENPRIDWDAETAVPEWLQEEIKKVEMTTVADAAKRGKTEAGIEVLLTGASSFPGSHILTALLHHPSVRKVHCIAVPSDHHHQLSSSIPSASVAEVAYYTGTLLSKNLGLTPTERNHLAQTVHIIVHTAAHGHCLNRFATLRRPNLEALHSLASLSLASSLTSGSASSSLCKTAIPILYLSSPRTLLLAGTSETPRPPSSLRDFPPPAVDGSDGYTASKWAGEVFLENLISPSLNIAVHRSCTLVSSQAPNSDAMNGILRYSLAMRTVPRLRRAKGFLDFAPLDDVVGRIAAAAVELASVPRGTSPSVAEASPPSSSIHFRHHSGGIKTPFSQFRTHMETVYGGAFDEVDMQEWLVRAARQGLDPLITAYIEALLESGMPLVSPYLGEE